MSCTLDVQAKKRILGIFSKSLNELDDDVKLIKSWLLNKNHLPEIPSKNMIEYFIVNNRFCLETSKEKINMYYEMRKLLPNLYKEINPKTPRMKKSLNAQYILPLPRLVNGLHRVIFIKNKKDTGHNFDTLGMIGNVLNVYEVRMHEDLAYGDILLFDYGNLEIGHVLRTTPNHARMVKVILEKTFSNRIEEIHIINHSFLFNILFSIAKPFISVHLREKMHFHDSIDSLASFIPWEVLPKDYAGGLEKSLDELEVMWKQKLEQYQDRFDQLDTLNSDENAPNNPHLIIMKPTYPCNNALSYFTLIYNKLPESSLQI
ncbi:unnamed protein product [Phyllotreta striolata]|uniref:CRAL-TRIO domain-containing protein n=1 Tax=Phyllotreta striolata TaxID=444603 RepID=A0A9N9XMH6_PHYSR|nr:unnamed protein product [Phyllotreta striolata]